MGTLKVVTATFTDPPVQPSINLLQILKATHSHPITPSGMGAWSPLLAISWIVYISAHPPVGLSVARSPTWVTQSSSAPKRHGSAGWSRDVDTQVPGEHPAHTPG